ncbi:MAG: hypothetical protein GY832_17550 [Chloroflexi bacterium]|nr:hypothetical protein [Chloroflexota bacterium]
MEDQQVSLDGSDSSGNPSGDGVSLSNGSDGGTQDSTASGGNTFASGLEDEGNRALVESKGWAHPDHAISAYREIEAYQGKSVALPGEEASDDDWKSFRQKMGTPETSDAYTFTGAEEADETAVNSLKELFHGAELDQHQAEALYKGLSENYQVSQQAAEEQHFEHVNQAKTDASKALTREWGAQEGEVFKRNIEMARRAVVELGGDGLFDELRSLGAITDDNQVLSPVLAKAFAEVGNQLFAEDGLVDGGDTVSVNPFAEDTMNLTAQGALVKSDPARARAMIRAAGKRPEDYGLSSN